VAGAHIEHRAFVPQINFLESVFWMVAEAGQVLRMPRVGKAIHEPINPAPPVTSIFIPIVPFRALTIYPRLGIRTPSA